MKYRELYPANWSELAFACKQQAGWRCEECGVAHLSVAYARRTGLPYLIYLAACHLDHDPWNPTPRLRCLCPACHMRYDWSFQERQKWLALEVLRHRLLLLRRGYRPARRVSVIS